MCFVHRFDKVGTEREIAMNQLSASLNYDRLATNRTAPSHARAFAESGFSAAPTDSESMDFWSRIYDLRGGAVRPWDGAAIASNRSYPDRDARTARAIEDAVMVERNRLARELHDAVTQTLFAASLIAEVLPDLWEMDEAEAHKSTEELRQLTRGALAEMRTLLFELRPAALNQARLPDLLKQISEAVMGRRGLPVCLDVQGDCEIPCDAKVEMYRIVQESLNNVVKYARASRVEICVRLEAGHVRIQVNDNGVGFDPACVKPTSLGLRIMRERAEAIHARLQVTSQPGLGTTVSLDWHE
jgi:signal transduction histidine kinase